MRQVHKNILITGRVQGVGFRFKAREAARENGIRGYVKNLPDERVYIEAEGTPEDVDRFIAWCKSGPPRARIETTQITDGELKGFYSFGVEN